MASARSIYRPLDLFNKIACHWKVDMEIQKTCSSYHFSQPTRIVKLTTSIFTGVEPIGVSLNIAFDSRSHENIKAQLVTACTRTAALL